MKDTEETLQLLLCKRIRATSHLHLRSKLETRIPTGELRKYLGYLRRLS
jgi:hypothetical protein